MSIDPFDAYEQGRLSPEDRAAFEARLDTEPDLAQSLSDYRTARTAIELAGDQVLREQLKQRYRQTQKPPRRIGRWLAAATILIVIASFSLWNIFRTSPTTTSLFADYQDTPAFTQQVRSGVAQTDRFQKAAQAYQSGNYTAAADSLQALVRALPSSSSQTAFYAYHTGIAFFQQAKWEVAVSYFQQVTDNSPLRGRANWYSALAYLAQEQPDVAQSILQKHLEMGYRFKQLEATSLVDLLIALQK